MTHQTNTDVLVLGSGAAGLSFALRVADNTKVSILAKGELSEGSSLYAQGGVAAVLNNNQDSLESHIEDTKIAGVGLCRDETVEQVIHHGPEAIQWLINKGVSFTANVGENAHANIDNGNNSFHLTREGGHSHRRVFHAADTTGRAIETTLEAQVRAHKNIAVFEDHIAIDLITRAKLTGESSNNACLGAYVLNRATGKILVFAAKQIVMATGGAAKVYLYTSNPDTSTGDGIAMAWRAGCRVGNMEFVQFHPTCLYHPKAKSFLISEAVRGEGGKLKLTNGEAFMDQHDPRGELAPRDIVARAIDFEMKRRGDDHVDLDISHLSKSFIKKHFPNIYERCRSFGIDITTDPIPVVPAAHYTCGGILTDLSARTDLQGLYAIGECAFTGLHGANRLASNSLLECLVFAKLAADDIKLQLKNTKSFKPEKLPPWDESRVTDADEQIVVSHNWDELRRFMWDYVGIVRTTKRLQRAQHRVDLLKDEIKEYYSNFKITNDLIELRNLVDVAELIIRSALARKESRGLHYTRDFPGLDVSSTPKDTIFTPPASQYTKAGMVITV